MPNITKKTVTQVVPEYVYQPGTSWSGSTSVVTYTKWYSPNVNRQRRNELATRGWMTPTSYFVEEEDRTASQMTAVRKRWAIVYQQPGYYWRGDGWFPYPPTYGWVSDTFAYARWNPIESVDMTSIETRLKNSALSSAIDRMRSQSVSVIETVVEAKKSFNMILDHTTRIAQAIGYVKRGKFVKAASALGLRRVPANVKSGANLSSNWLAYRYGWMPLYYTVYGAMENIYKIRTRHEHSVHRVNAKATDIGTAIRTAASSQGYFPATWTDTFTNKCQMSVRCELTYKISSSTRTTLSEWGLTNPALVAWELLPLSFVADWFVNISDVLKRIDALEGKAFCCGTYTVKRSDTTTRSAKSVVWSADASGNIPNASATRRNFKREVFLTLPYVKPQLSFGLSTNHIIDAAALIRQFSR